MIQLGPSNGRRAFGKVDPWSEGSRASAGPAIPTFDGELFFIATALSLKGISDSFVYPQ
jgi:hypothetical protein